MALLTADTYRIAPQNSAKNLCQYFETPFRVIYTPEELQTAVKDYWDCDYIFIDTAGRSHQNADQLEKMKEGKWEHERPRKLSCVSGSQCNYQI